MQYDLTPSEAAEVDFRRLTPDQRAIAILTKAEEQRQARLNAMTPENKAIAEADYLAQMQERSRIDNLPDAEREAEMALKRQERLTQELADVEETLVKPEIQAVLEKVQLSLDSKIKVQ